MIFIDDPANNIRTLEEELEMREIADELDFDMWREEQIESTDTSSETEKA